MQVCRYHLGVILHSQSGEDPSGCVHTVLDAACMPRWSSAERHEPNKLIQLNLSATKQFYKKYLDKSIKRVFEKLYYHRSRKLIMNLCVVFRVESYPPSMKNVPYSRMLKKFFSVCKQLKVGCAGAYLYITPEHTCHFFLVLIYHHRCSCSFSRQRWFSKAILWSHLLVHATHISNTGWNILPYLPYSVFFKVSWTQQVNTLFACFCLPLPISFNIASAHS